MDVDCVTLPVPLPRRVLSLFSGAGGADMALEAAGFDIAALCEIEPHARAVLREHWPAVPLHGDVCELDGTAFQGVTVVVGGSPCQDLSVAGKRAGLAEGSGTRSALFHEQVRVWRESQAPYLIWENVKGAYSSSAGADFAAVLSALVGAPVAVPRDGWSNAGVVAGPAAVAAWRLLDLQHFGVPQRRERIVVLASRAGGVDPAEVLALGQGVRGDPAPRYPSREGTAGAAQGGAGGGGAEDGLGPTLRARAPRDDSDAANEARATILQSVAHTLTGTSADASEEGTGRGTPNVVVPLPSGEAVDIANCLTAREGKGPNPVREVGTTVVQAVAHRGREGGAGAEVDDSGVMFALRAPGGGSSRAEVIAPVAPTLTHQYAEQSGQDDDAAIDDRRVAPFRERAITSPDNRSSVEFGASAPTLAEDPVQVVAPLTLANRQREGKPGGGKGPLISHEMSLTLAQANDQTIVSGLGVRMLTPRECERIMDWPDDWTRYGVNEKGVRYELADTPRYRLCGNGIAKVWLEWTARRLMAAIRAAEAEDAVPR